MNLFNNYKFIFTILSIILFAPLPIRSQKIFTYKETQTENPIIQKIHNYDDNTMVVHIVRVNSSDPSSNETLCLDGFLSLRTIFPDGNVVPFDIQLDIPYLNFCLLVVDNKVQQPLKTYSVRSNFLLVSRGFK